MTATNDVPRCPQCGSANGFLGTEHAYFICRDCKAERYWTPDHRHPVDSGLTWKEGVALSPWRRPNPPSVIAEIPTVESPPPPTGASKLIRERDEAQHEQRETKKALEASHQTALALSASLTALREAILTLAEKWSDAADWEYNHGDQGFASGLDQCSNELSAALTASREQNAQTHRD